MVSQTTLMVRHTFLTFVILALISRCAYCQSEIPIGFDFARLAHPSVANELKLTDEQRAQIGRLLIARANALTSANDNERKQAIQNSNRELFGLLSDEQQRAIQNIDKVARLRFSFDQQKWSDVLQWVAEQADMTLVYDQIPDQKFSYRDSREYSVGEAIDLLNGILLSKGYTIIRRDKLLIVAELSPKIPNELLPEVTAEQLSQYGQFELVRMRIPLGTRPVEAVEKEIRSIISQFGQMSVLPQSRQLLVTETASKLAAINRLVAAIPEPSKPQPKPEAKPAPQPTLAVYPIQGIDPAAAVETIKNLMGDDVKHSVDRTASTISVFAVPSQQEAIQSALDQLMAGSSPDQRARLQTFEIQVDDYEAFKNQIQLVAPNSQVAIDRDNRRLIVFGSPAELASVSAVISSDDQSARKQPTIVAYPLEDAEAIASIAEILQAIAPEATVATSTLTNSVVVRATPRDHEQIEKLVAQLNSENRDKPALATYPIEAALRETIETAVAELVPKAAVTWDSIGERLLIRATLADHAQIRTVIDSLRTDPPQTTLKTYAIETSQQPSLTTTLAKVAPAATITSDVANERLVVIATPQDHQQISNTITALAPGKKSDLGLRVYSFPPPLQPRVSALLSTFDADKTPPKIVDNTQPGELAILASDAQHSRFDDLLRQLRDQDQKRDKLTLQAYPVIHSDPNSLQAVIRELFPNTKIIVDTDSNRLMIWAGEENQDAIRQSITQLDVERDSIDLELLRAYDLPGLEITNLTSTLGKQFPTMVLSHDTPNKKLLAWGTEKSHVKLNETIARLIEEYPPKGTSIKTYPTSPRTPDQVISLLASNVPTARLTPDSESETIIALATDEEHKLIQAALDQLPSLDDSPLRRELVAYDVDPNEFANVANVLAKIAPQATVTNASDNRQLFVWGTVTEHLRVRETLATIKVDVPHTERSVRVYKLRPGNAATLVEVIASVVPQAQITSQQTNQLTIWATGSDHGRIAELAEQLETETKLPELVVRTYSLAGAGGANVLEMLGDDLGPESSVTVSADGRRLLVRASESDHQRLTELIPNIIKQLGNNAAPGTVRIYPLQNTSGTKLVELLTPDLSPTATVTISSDGKRLIVRAKEEEHERIAALVPNFIEQLGEEEEPVNRVYRPNVADVETVLDVFDDLLPSIRTALDESGQFVSVTALPSEHEQLQSLFEAMEQGTPSRPTPQSYRLANTDADAVADSLRVLMRRRRGIAISVDRGSNSLFVVAPPREQELIGNMIKEFDSQQFDEKGDYSTEIYGNNELSSRTLENVLQAALSKDALVDSDPFSQMVIVRASARDQAIAQQTVQRLVEQLPEADSRVSRIYHVESADPEVVENIFDDVAPRARVQADSGTRTVTVTASVAEHKRMQEILEQIESGLSNAPVPHTYKIEQSDPNAVYESLLELFDSDDVGVTWQPGSDSLLVVTTDRRHEMVAKIVDEFNKPGGLASDDDLQVYSLKDIDGNAARTALESLLSNETPPPRIEFDGSNNQLLAIATTEQHNMIRDALGRMKREQRDLEFFQLQVNDAFSLELAIEGLFKDLPESAAPQVESNIETQQLIVRATKEQMQKVRDLLTRMGESVNDPTGQDNRRIRTIPFYGDVENTMQRLQELWPQMHSNELRIIYPVDYDGGRLLKTLPSNSNLDDHRQPTSAKLREPIVVPPAPSPTPLPPGEPQVDDVPDQRPAARSSPDIVFGENTARPAIRAQQPPPIVVIPGEGKLTISSNDPEALNEFESLLRIFAAPERSPANDVAIFGLRNASAVDTAQLLEDFFEEIPTWGRLGKVIVVPDARLNALVVHASKSGREVVREVLAVLDAGEDESRAKFNTPRIVPVKHSSATRILAILQTLYATQLTSGAGRRKQIDIPSGVDEDVAAILEQLNASSAGPLLTLEADMTTNSIILLAPPQLAEEVTSLIGQLDQGADEAVARGIRVISLKNMRSELLGEVLKEFKAAD